ncbi:MAG: AAA family ATPase [Xenococcaceae cyanobacterium MO_188.B32]|nr:AAA family ATPase [Xenococcaceae cyanobacterium MO_188.B32]
MMNQPLHPDSNLLSVQNSGIGQKLENSHVQGGMQTTQGEKNIQVQGEGNVLTFNKTEILQISVETITNRELIKTSPYKGLKRFNFKDRDHFFGRDRLIARLLEAVNQKSLSLVLGASGSGKSSLVRAGLIPEFKKSLTSQTFYNFIFTPNQDPFDSLYRCLLNEEKDYSFSKTEAEIALKAKTDTLTELISTLRKDGEQWLIFVDQFEELFTICDHPDKRKNFIEGLVQVANSKDTSVRIVLAMRADFLEQLSSYPDLGIIANQNNIHLVTDMHPDELRQAIEQPAARHGVVFEEGLVEQIIKEVEGQKGYLPLLQYTLDLLWQTECKTLDANGSPHIEDRTLNKTNYAALEGVRGALQKRVNEIYSNLNQDEQSVTKQIFVRLVNIVDTDSGSKTVSRRANRSEFVGELVNNTLQTFIDENLLVSSAEDLSAAKLQISDSKSSKQSATLEIAHEILLSSWDKLKNWIEEEKEAIILKNWLAGETKRWQKIRLEDESKVREELLKGSRLEQIVEFRKKDTFKNVGGLRAEENQFIDASIKWQQQQEQQKKNRRRNTVVSLAIFSVISLGLASFAAIQLLKVKEAELEANRAKSAALQDKKRAEDALNEAKEAEQLRQEELVRSTWVSLKTLEINYEECGTWLKFGLRDLYCRIKPFADYRKLIAISGLAIFRSGPHSDSELNFDGGYKFGYYNPEFLKWIQENVIIDSDDNLFKQSIQSAYNDKIRVVARAFYQSHKILFATPEEFEAFKKEYEVVQKKYRELLRTRKTNVERFSGDPLEFEVIKRGYQDKIDNKTLPGCYFGGNLPPEKCAGIYIQKKFRWLADYLATENERIDEQRNYWYLANVSGGFWVRRSIDGTEEQFFDILTKLLETYDSDWLRPQESLEVKPSR